MDTKKLVERLRAHTETVDMYGTLRAVDVCLNAADAIERLERERDEAREAAAFHEHNWRQERDLKLGMAAELTTLRARVERLEEALRSIDAKIVDLGLAAQRKANGHKHEKFAAVRQSMRLIVRDALAEEPAS